MQYISPFHILEDFTGGTAYDQALLRKVKKRILSEFELTGETTISLGGKEMDKDAVLKFFERLQQESIDIHLKIYNDKLLLHFLEHGDLDFFDQEELLLEYEEEQYFLKFIAPYFNHHYNQVLYTAIREQDLDKVERILKHDYPLFDVYQGEAYRNAYRYMRGKTNDLIDLTKRQKVEHINGSEVMSYFKPNFLAIFNFLPSYFNALRDEYANTVDTLAVDLHNKSRRTSLAIDILEAAMGLRIQKDTYNRLDYVLQQLKPYHQKYRTWVNRSERGQYWSFAIWTFQILIVLLILFFISRSSSSSSSSSFYTPEGAIPMEEIQGDYIDFIVKENYPTMYDTSSNEFDSTLEQLQKQILEMQQIKLQWEELLRDSLDKE